MTYWSYFGLNIIELLSELKKPLALALQNILYAGYDPGQELSRLYINREIFR